MIYNVKASDISDKVFYLVVKASTKDDVEYILRKENLFINDAKKDIKAVRIKEGIIFKTKL